VTLCDRIEARSMALMALPRSDETRLASEAHAATCAGCRRALREGARLLRLADLELRPAHAAQPLARAERAVLAAWNREPRTRWLAAVTPLAIFAVLCLTARHLVQDLTSWGTAAVVASAAALFSASAAAGKRTTPIALVSSFGLVVLASVQGGTVGS